MADTRDILVRLLGEETVSRMAGRAEKGLDRFGDSLDATERDARDLDAQIAEVEGSLKALAAAFSRTSDEADRIDLSKAIRQQQAELRKLTKVRGLLGEAAEAGAELGRSMSGGLGRTLSGGVSGVFKAMPPQVQGAVVAAGAAMGVSLAAAIGAALTAGVLLAVGGGVLAAGIKAASSSPQVQAAWKTFGERAKSALKDFGSTFEGPLIRAADTFGDALERMAPTLTEMADSVSPIIDKLAPALAEMAEKSLPGIQKAMEASKPLWDTLAEHLPQIGQAVSRFFEEIAKGGPGANEFLADFLNWLEGIIIVLGVAIGKMAEMYSKVKDAWRGIKVVFAEGVQAILAVIGTVVRGAAKAFGWIPGLGPKIQGAAKEFEKFRNRANAALDGIKDETVNVDVNLRGIRNLEEQMAVRLGRRASGGPVDANTPYLVGEEGPELVTPTRDGYVHDARTTARMLAGTGRALAAPMNGASGTASGGTQRVEVVLRVEGNDRGIVGALMKAIKDMGGDPSVFKLGGNW